MSNWLILTERSSDFDQASTPYKVLSVRDYVAKPELFRALRPIVLNLSRSYAYRSAGYYASLLAEARGHRVLPTAQTMLELSRKGLYAAALPDLEDALNREARRLGFAPEADFRLLVGFGQAYEHGLQRFARLLFDWFRCPLIDVSVQAGPWLRIKRLRPVSPHRLRVAERAFLTDALAQHCRRSLSVPKPKVPLRWSLAVLHNPREALPPTGKASLLRLAQVGARMGVEVEPIQQRDLPRLAEFDGLFIRETTSVNDHTFRFARRAEQEGMPVIDDTTSMVRCTNKVYLKERLQAAKLPMPASIVLSNRSDLSETADRLGFPMVVKIPDGSFSRGVDKIDTLAALKTHTKALFRETDLLLAQEFMPTAFDWRVGVLAGKPLFACQYMMAKKHWQIIRHGESGRFDEGRFKTFAVEHAPADVIDTAVRASALMGTGLYGVDLKQNDRGVFVIEINDNPNLDTAIEGAVIKDDLCREILQWFLNRLEPKTGLG